MGRPVTVRTVTQKNVERSGGERRHRPEKDGPKFGGRGIKRSSIVNITTEHRREVLAPSYDLPTLAQE